jgi:exodeoxyribonuclease V beta subunit
MKRMAGDKEMAREKKITPFDLLGSPLEGTNLIEASAGTGKTYTLSGLFLRLILEKRFSVDEILVVTYTVAATEELRDRIRKKLRETLDALGTGRSEDVFVTGLIKKISNAEAAIQLLQEALHDFDKAPIFTIHGFCQRMLHENAFESGSLFDTELTPDQRGIEQEIVFDFWRLHFYGAPPEFVSHAQDKKFSPQKFLKLLGKRIAHPDLEIVPDCGPSELRSLKPFREVFEKLKKEWQRTRANVLERMSDTALNQAQYKNPSRFLDAMDNYLANERGILPLFKGFEKFTKSNLTVCTRKGCATPVHPFFNLCEEFQIKAETLQEEMDRHLLYLKREIFRYAKEELPVRKGKRNVQFFDDLLIRLRSSLEKEGGDDLARAIRTKYRAALVDEFQDTDPVQYAIFRNIFLTQESILFLIGDPKQAIYSFRGADFFAYMRAAGQVKTRYTLTRNWRSEPGLIGAVNSVFSNRGNPFLYNDVPFEPALAEERKGRELLTIDGKSEPPFHLWYVDAGKVIESGRVIAKGRARELLPRAVALEISRLLSLGKHGKARIGMKEVREGDMAVLVRTNKEAGLIQDQLTRLRIHSVLHTTGNLFDTEDALDMERVLAGIAEPGQEQLVRVALATHLLGVAGEELDLLMSDEAAWESWLSRFREYCDLWERGGFIRVFRYFMLREKVRNRLLALPDGERRLTNVLHLSEVLHQEATEQKLGMVGLLKWLAQQRDPGSPRLDEHQLRLESDANAVRIVTIHKSKGLEYPIVFCPFNWDGSQLGGKEEFTFHDPGHDWRLNLAIDPEGNPQKALAEKEILAENLRLLYVSLTRAKNRCYLAWGRFNEAETSSLAYLLHPVGEGNGEVVTATAEHIHSLKNEEIRSDLEAIAKKAAGQIQFLEMPMGPGRERPSEEEKIETLTCRTFSGAIERDRRIASFTYLMSSRQPGAKLSEEVSPAHASPEHATPQEAMIDSPDHDEAPAGDGKIPEEEPSGIFAFPRGARPGVLLHDIFENLDFAGKNGSSVEKLVGEKLRQYGFEMKWQETLCDMIGKVLAVPLLPGKNGLTLSSVTMKDRLSELEFYFPLEPITPKKLKEIFARHGDTGIPAEFPDRIGGLNFQPARGFMKGFMDLVFQYQGRFYLVDWKSNLLGHRVPDYGPEAMAAEMGEQFYILQYHLYVIALSQYLKMRNPDYDYDRHFGGVFYIFLRGVDPESGPEYGVYRDRPKRELIDTLCETLIAPPPAPQS